MDEAPEINPSQSLFDNRTLTSPTQNLKYLQQAYSFYLPDPEYCIDVEGFLGYCNEKVRWGNLCLYCQKPFGSAESVLKHMKDKEHCKVRYERGVDMEEFDVFYDFSTQNDGGEGEDEDDDGGVEKARMALMETTMEEDAEGWEDVDGEDEDASMQEDGGEEDDDDLYSAYESEINSQGFDITPLGELIFPDGRIVGHRGLARYYKQRFAPDRTERAAVRHAKEAAGDRMYNGRVVNLYRLQGDDQQQQDGGGNSSTALANTMGRMAGNIPTGRNGRGILVSGGGKGGFSSLSLYRYRAVVKKARKDDARGQRLELSSRMNMNRMDKKANNKMTGVCVALAPR